MNLGRTSNPALSTATFNRFAQAGEASQVMTVQGTINKALMMLALLALGGYYTWDVFFEAVNQQQGAQLVGKWIAIGGIGGFILALVTIFKKEWAPYSAPLYAVLEGLFLGAASAMFEARYPGIVMQAVMLTFGTLFSLLFAYRAGWIKVTQKFRMGVVAATGGIFFAYLLSFILGMFGINMGFIHGNGIVGIGVSLVIIVVAALNLVLDFDFIEKGAEQGAPKFMEWYGAFGLIVTLVWLYIEFLRLLSKLSSRN